MACSDKKNAWLGFAETVGSACAHRACSMMSAAVAAKVMVTVTHGCFFKRTGAGFDISFRSQDGLKPEIELSSAINLDQMTLATFV